MQLRSDPRMMSTTSAVSALVSATAAATLLLYTLRRSRLQQPRDDADGADGATSRTAVLDFWFGGDLGTLYDSRWFVQSGSAAQRELDAEIRTRFGAVLACAECGELDDLWCDSPHGTLALIVLLDQLSRHAHRGDEDAVRSNDARALRLTRQLLARGWDTSLDVAQLIFALMPLRHQPTEERLREVLERTAPRLDVSEASTQLLVRFRRHTQLRLLHLEGRGDPHDILERPDLEAQLEQAGAPDEVRVSAGPLPSVHFCHFSPVPSVHFCHFSPVPSAPCAHTCPAPRLGLRYCPPPPLRSSLSAAPTLCDRHRRPSARRCSASCWSTCLSSSEVGLRSSGPAEAARPAGPARLPSSGRRRSS